MHGHRRLLFLFGVVGLISLPCFGITDLFDGSKRVDKSWDMCIVLQNTIKQENRPSFKVDFSGAASGSLWLDNKKKFVFENAPWATLQMDISAGKHSFRIELEKPATVTGVSILEKAEWCSDQR